MPNLPGYGGGKLPVRRSKPKPAKKPKAPVQRPAAPTVREQSPLGLAQSLVRQEMAPYYQQVSQAQAEQEAYERRRQQAIQGFTQALIGQIQGDPGRISADYEHAISQQSGLAAQSAAALGAASTAPASQALLGAVGAPPEQQAQMAAGLAATFQGGGGVMQHTQGTIPGQTFSGQQLAQLAYARGMPSIAASRGFGALSEALGLSADERRELRNKRLEIAAQEPGLIEKTRAGIIEGRTKASEAQYKAQEARTKAQLAVSKERRQAYYQQQSLLARRADRDIKQAYLELATARTAQDQANAIARLNQAQARLQQAQRRLDASLTGIDPATGDPVYVKPARAADPAKARAKAQTNRSKAWVQLDKTIIRVGKSGLGKPMPNPDFEKGFSKMPYLTAEGKPTNNPQRATRMGRQNGDTLLTQIYQGYGTDLETRFKVPKSKITGRIRSKLRKLGYKV